MLRVAEELARDEAAPRCGHEDATVDVFVARDELAVTWAADTDERRR